MADGPAIRQDSPPLLSGADEHLDVTYAVYNNDGSALGKRLNGARSLIIRAGRRKVRHVVPPAGDDYAFDVQEWEREVTVYVSPTGRSVRVWVDGKEAPAP